MKAGKRRPISVIAHFLSGETMTKTFGVHFARATGMLAATATNRMRSAIRAFCGAVSPIATGQTAEWKRPIWPQLGAMVSDFTKSRISFCAGRDPWTTIWSFGGALALASAEVEMRTVLRTRAAVRMGDLRAQFCPSIAPMSRVGAAVARRRAPACRIARRALIIASRAE